MLNEILFQQTPHILVYKWGPIITNQIRGDPKPGDNVLTNEIGNCYPSGFLQRNGFHPFCEVFSNTRNHIWPLERGLIGPIRSRPQVWKGHGVVISWNTFE